MSAAAPLNGLPSNNALAGATVKSTPPGVPLDSSLQQQQQQPRESRKDIVPGSSSSSTKVHSSSPNVVGMHYKVGKKIGEGSFGIIYEGVNIINNQPIAIKFEPRKSDAPQLRDEYRTYKILAHSVGIPNVYYYGQEGLHNILCIDLLGPSLEDMFDLCNRRFSIKTVCMAAKQMITRVQTIHEKNLIYRDIKPDNFLIGRLPRHSELAQNPNNSPDPFGVVSNHSVQNPHPASQIYMVDFGMAKLYRDPKTKQHIPYREKKSLSGTARYMSINTHLGREQSRRDDLESLGHVFMYFLRGSLPWQGLKAASNKQKYEKIGEKKQTTPIKDLCDGFPEEFAVYLKTVREYKFEETPDYDLLRGLMNKVLAKIGEVDDGVFDWMVAMDIQRKEKERQREADREARERERAARHAAQAAQQQQMQIQQHYQQQINMSPHPTSASVIPMAPSPIPSHMHQLQAHTMSPSPSNLRIVQPSTQHMSKDPSSAAIRMSMQMSHQEATGVVVVDPKSNAAPGAPVSGRDQEVPTHNKKAAKKKKWWKKMFGWCGSKESDNQH